jgi:hypothetical protein
MKPRHLLPVSLAFAGGFLSGVLLAPRSGRQTWRQIVRSTVHCGEAVRSALIRAEHARFTRFPVRLGNWAMSEDELLVDLRAMVR